MRLRRYAIAECTKREKKILYAIAVVAECVGRAQTLSLTLTLILALTLTKYRAEFVVHER